MASIGPLFHSPPRSPEDAQTARTFEHAAAVRDNGAKLLELRTETGRVFVCPSRWQRIRLWWTFRHFHVVPPQLLSRHDRRMIEELSRTAVVAPVLPVTSDRILGVVETTRSKSLARSVETEKKTGGSDSQAVSFFPPEPLLVEKLRIGDLPTLKTSRGESIHDRAPVQPGEPRSTSRGRPAWRAGDVRLQQWCAATVLGAFCVAAVLARAYGLFPGTEESRNPQAPPAPTAQATGSIQSEARSSVAAEPGRVSATNAFTMASKRGQSGDLLPPAPSLSAAVSDPVPLTPVSRKPTQSVSTVAAAGPSAEAAADVSRLPFVSELPLSPFAHPVISESSPVGELQLRAVIGKDGSVKDVAVVSGNPGLAKAGIRAVRQWHYSPYEDSGNPVEVETQIKMNFFGPDAISISSVSEGAAIGTHGTP
jgi:Gram-negative bacterial TonB protein C-terminal